MLHKLHTATKCIIFQPDLFSSIIFLTTKKFFFSLQSILPTFFPPLSSIAPIKASSTIYLPSSEIFGPMWPIPHSKLMQSAGAGMRKHRHVQVALLNKPLKHPQSQACDQPWAQRAAAIASSHLIYWLPIAAGNKLPQINWLIYSFIVLEVRSPKWVLLSVVNGQGISRVITSGSCRGDMFSYLFQLLEFTCISWLIAPSSIFKTSSIPSSKSFFGGHYSAHICSICSICGGYLLSCKV